MIEERFLDLSEFDESLFQDPLGRNAGDALDPLRHSVADLLLRKRASERLFAALWQQTPRTDGGMLIKPYEWFTLINPMQLDKVNGILWVRAWDLAFTEKQVAGSNPDFTVGAKVGLWKNDKDFYLIIADIVRWRESWGVTKQKIIDIAKDDGVHVKLAAENQGPQKAAFSELKTAPELADFRLYESNPVRDKVARAQGWIDDAESGLVFMLPGPSWHEIFFNECEAFPFGNKDDQVDAISIAYEYLKRFTKGSSVRRFKVRGLYK